MKIYIASKSGNRNFALDPDNIIAACATGPSPLTDAQSYAKDHVRGTEESVFIFEVDAKPLGSYKIYKEVTFVAPPKP
jgi:hypothetical protein